jgi:hypothetical protein
VKINFILVFTQKYYQATIFWKELALSLVPDLYWRLE